MPAPADQPPRLVVVSPPERRIIGQLTHDGASNITIALRLGVTENTVKSHMKRILRATDCPDRTALVVALLKGRITIRTESRSGRIPRPTHIGAVA